MLGNEANVMTDDTIPVEIRYEDRVADDSQPDKPAAPAPDMIDSLVRIKETGVAGASKIYIGDTYITDTGDRADAAAMARDLRAALRKVMEPLRVKLDVLQGAIDRSGMDLSPCHGCGAVVVTIPDGMPEFCEACAEKEERL